MHTIRDLENLHQYIVDVDVRDKKFTEKTLGYSFSRHGTQDKRNRDTV